MKKTFLFSLGLIVAFTSLFVSCGDKNNDANVGGTGSGDDVLICKVSVSNTEGGCAKITNYVGTSANILIGNGVEVVAVPDDGYNFIGWFIGDSQEPVSTDATYTFTVLESVTLVAKFESKNNINGHEYVDLGLPSGLKWATCNVGAITPEEYGGYYAWGETEEKSNYEWFTYKLCNGSWNTMTKYCTESRYGTVDNKTVLDPEDDVAHVKWGGSWRMPTRAEQDELRNNCDWEWTTINGANGYRVTGPNGNSIFLPAAGYRLGAGFAINNYSNGYYWSSSLYSNNSNFAYYLYFYDNYYNWNDNNRCNGQSVRPVSK